MYISNFFAELEALELTLKQYLENCTLGLESSKPGKSCAEIFCRNDVCHNDIKKSGEYWVKTASGKPSKVYCAYQPIPNRDEKAMRRVGYLDMTDSKQNCPPNFRQISRSEKRICGRTTITGGCSSITFNTSNIPYTTICGRVKAYHYGSPSGFYTPRSSGGGFNINSPYLEGVSITRGSPRKHVWSFANALAESIQRSQHICPCINSNHNQQRYIPGFVGQDYFCDTGSHDYPPVGVLYPDDPLWDGKGCESPSTCCTFNSPPWFCKELSTATTDDIELRLCADEDAYVNEDSPIEQIEIYVK